MVSYYWRQDMNKDIEKAEARLHEELNKLSKRQQEGIIGIASELFNDDLVDHIKDWTEALKFEGLQLEPYLKQSRLSKGELAEKLSMSRGMLYNYINGNVKEPKLLIILAIRYLLDMPLDYLLKKGNSFFESKSSSGYPIYQFDEMNQLIKTHDRLTFEKPLSDDGLAICVVKLNERNELLDLNKGDYIALKELEDNYLFNEDKDTYALIYKKYNPKDRNFYVIKKPFLTKITRTTSIEKDEADGKNERSRRFIYVKDGKTYLTTQNKLLHSIRYVVIQAIKHY